MIPDFAVFLFYFTMLCKSDFLTSTPAPNPCSSNIPTSEISEISLRYIRHYGLLYERENSRQIKRETVFSNNGYAQKTGNEIKRDGEEKRQEKQIVYRAILTKQQFEKLANITAENNFFSENDSKERMSEADNFFLKAVYSGGEKEIQTSNLGKDTVAVTEILKAFRALENELIWIAER